MEQILKAIKEKIKSLLEEDIEPHKLRELLNIYEQLKGYTVTSISQVNQNEIVQRYGTIPVQPIMNNIPENLPRNEISMFTDILKDTLLRQNKKVAEIDTRTVSDYIWNYRFLDERENKYNFVSSEERNKTLELKDKLYLKILELIEKELDKEQEKSEIKELENEVFKENK